MDTNNIVIRDVEKHYGAVKALVGVNFTIHAGEVHGIIGENGAGKSTLIKILSGTIRPSKGTLSLFGEEVEYHSPIHARNSGVQTVFQELTLIQDLTVADNLLNIRKSSSVWHRTTLSKTVSQAKQILQQYHVNNIEPRSLVRDLALPQRQTIEIIKALIMKPKVLILDEATSALSQREVEWLFAQVRALREAGVTILFTSHRWEEVQEITDRVTVLRNGESVGTYDTKDLTEDKATTLITGRKLDVLYPTLEVPSQEVRLSVKDMSSDTLHDISFDLHKGEILGVGGLQGQGQRELFLSLFGALGMKSGEIVLNGKKMRLRNPHDAIHADLRFGFVPEDRKTEGLFLNLGIMENTSLPSLERLSRLGWVNRKQERMEVQGVSQRLKVKTPSLTQNVINLSGGNQQKVLVGRWLMADSQVLLLYDVTRGVDVGTKHDIYELMVELTKKGVSILFYSSETAEVVHLSHRVAVMVEGRIGKILSGNELSEEAIVGVAIGSRSEKENPANVIP